MFFNYICFEQSNKCLLLTIGLIMSINLKLETQMVKKRREKNWSEMQLKKVIGYGIRSETNPVYAFRAFQAVQQFWFEFTSALYLLKVNNLGTQKYASDKSVKPEPVLQKLSNSEVEEQAPPKH